MPIDPHPTLTRLLISQAAWWLLGLLLPLGACQPDDEPVNSLRMYVFNGGELRSPDASVLSPGVNVGRPLVLGNPAFLIVHPRGALMWDTGFADSLARYPDGVQDDLATVLLKRPLRDQLAAIGVDPSQVNFLALSHLHTDHAGNAESFAGATLLIQREEFEAGFGGNSQNYLFDRELYDGLSRIQILEGDHDVFGDGTVVIKKAPGHSPGHQVLLVRLPKTGAVVLSGDLYHTAQNREIRGVPIFNFNRDQTLQSMDEIERFIRENGAQLWIQHDSAFNASTRFSPDFYR